jgi:hypothetical protein
MPASEIVNPEIIGQNFSELFMSRPPSVRQRSTNNDISAWRLMRMQLDSTAQT